MAKALTDPKILKRRRWFAGIMLLVVAVAIIFLNRTRINYPGLASFTALAAAGVWLESKLKRRTNRIIFFGLMWMLMLGVLLSLDFIIYGTISKSFEALFASFFCASGLTIFQTKPDRITD